VLARSRRLQNVLNERERIAERRFELPRRIDDDEARAAEPSRFRLDSQLTVEHPCRRAPTQRIQQNVMPRRRQQRIPEQVNRIGPAPERLIQQGRNSLLTS
jgi:hypothetical protein